MRYHYLYMWYMRWDMMTINTHHAPLFKMVSLYYGYESLFRYYIILFINYIQYIDISYILIYSKEISDCVYRFWKLYSYFFLFATGQRTCIDNHNQFNKIKWANYAKNDILEHSRLNKSLDIRHLFLRIIFHSISKWSIQLHIWCHRF